VTPEQKKVCEAIELWAKIQMEREEGEKNQPFTHAWSEVYWRGISKSCLLDRMLYGGEKPSQTPCPVHKGRWSGIHMWGSRLMPDGLYHVIGHGLKGEVDAGPEHESLKAERDAGCRCFQHSCGCTTGWQPEVAR
jgi:hypothetical protein